MSACNGALEDVAENILAGFFHDGNQFPQKRGELVDIAMPLLAAAIRLDGLQILVLTETVLAMEDEHARVGDGAGRLRFGT